MTEQNYCVDTSVSPDNKRYECYLIYGAIMKTHLLIDKIYDMCIDDNSELAKNIMDSIKDYESSLYVRKNANEVK